MSKTIAALDLLCSSIIELIPTWLSMLKSTRTLTAIGTVIVAYLTYTQSGLPKDQAMLAAITEAVTGISLIISKTIRSGAPAANGAAGTPPAAPAGTALAQGQPPPSVPGAGAPAPPAPEQPSPQQKYWDVPDTDQMYKNIIMANTDPNGLVNWFHVAGVVQDWYENRKLTNYHPDARIPLALAYNDLAIKARRQVFNVICKIPAPEDYTLVGTESQNAVITLVKKASPSCEALSEPQELEIVNLGKLYDDRRNILQLVGKSIKWADGYDTAQLLGHYGIMAIG